VLYGAAQRLASRLPRPRAATAETVIPPLALPSLPSRNYFLFQQVCSSHFPSPPHIAHLLTDGQPLDTRTLASTSKAECREAYQQLRQSVQDGIDTLLALSEEDPYRSFLRRAVYERITGRKAPVPLVRGAGAPPANLDISV
jgi:hypothetical protein